MPFTEIDAPPFAPLPCTASVVPWSEADETRMVDVVPPPPLPLPEPSLPEPLLNDAASGRRAAESGRTGSWQPAVKTRDAAAHTTETRFTVLLMQLLLTRRRQHADGDGRELQRTYGEGTSVGGERRVTAAGSCESLRNSRAGCGNEHVPFERYAGTVATADGPNDPRSSSLLDRPYGDPHRRRYAQRGWSRVPVYEPMRAIVVRSRAGASLTNSNRRRRCSLLEVGKPPGCGRVHRIALDHGGDRAGTFPI